MKTKNIISVVEGDMLQNIKRFLFANPSIGIVTCRGILKSLEHNSEEENLKLCSWLEGSLAVFKAKSKELKEDMQREHLLKKVNRHVEKWEEEFGMVSLGDLQLLSASTGLSLVDMGWDKGKITPTSIAGLLDEFMVGQEEYKLELGLTVYTHILRMRRPELHIPKSNLLVFGPSGVGKTSGIKILAELLKVNHGILNFERLVPEGIQGNKISDPFTRTLGADKDDMILVGDEVDKITDEEIRQELLSILDDKNVISFPTTFGTFREYREIPSKNVTCILCGKFDVLKKIVGKRVDTCQVGFNTYGKKVLNTEELYAQVGLDDIKEAFGSDELCGRISSYVRVRQLTDDDMVNIMLNKKESIFSSYQAFFKASNVSLELTDDGARGIADVVVKKYKELGARGLDIIIRRLLKEPMLHVGELNGKRIKIDKGFLRSYLGQNEY